MRSVADGLKESVFGRTWNVQHDSQALPYNVHGLYLLTHLCGLLSVNGFREKRHTEMPLTDDRSR